MKHLALLLGVFLALAPCGAAEAPPLLAALDKEVSDLAARTLQGVVRIRARQKFEAAPAPPQGMPGHVLALGRPSLSLYGFVWDRDGRIVAADIPDGTTSVRVTFQDGRETQGKVVGNDPLTRLAVVQVAAEGLQPLPLGDPAGVRPGTWAMVFSGTGEAAPGPHPVTVGAVETKGDYGGSVLSLAGGALPASSGGPVVNARGEVIGVQLAPPGRWGGEAGGTALAIPGVRAIVEQIQAGQPLKRGFLGIAIDTLTPEFRQMVRYPDGPGVLVQDVTEKGPAAAAGVQEQDVILAVNGAPVRTTDELRVAVQMLPPGKEAVLQVWRKGEKLDLKVVPGEMPQAPRQAQIDAGPNFGALPAPLGQLFNPAAPGAVYVVPNAGGGRPDAKMVTVDFQAKGLLEAVALLLNGTGFAFTLDPAILADAGLAARPFGAKATNTPLSQVLDQLCAHYGLAWQVGVGGITFRRK